MAQVGFKPMKFAPKCVSLNNTLTSGITKSDSTKAISELLGYYTDGFLHRVYLKVNNLVVDIAPSTASASRGEWIASFPAGMGLVKIEDASLKITSTAATGLSGAAGELGLGTLIGSGANATLGAVGATAEDIKGGTTISNHVAGTALVSEKWNVPGGFKAYTEVLPTYALDASASAKKIHLNIASAWTQGATGTLTFGGYVQIDYKVLGADFGIEG